MHIEALGTAARLGECPIWCGASQRLWWVDVLTPALWSYDQKRGVIAEHKVAARRIGSLALRKKGGLLLACDDGLYQYDPEAETQLFLVDPEPGRPGHRKNDGRADWAGNFWIGTLRETDYAPVGAIYLVSPELSVAKQFSGLAIPNALAFDQERRRVYFADTRAYTIWMSDYEAETGQIGERRVFARTAAPARPDGSCVDAEGFLWNAEYAGGRLVRYSPDGRIDRVLDLPVSHPTSCCFGGENLEQLWVTSASEPLSTAERLAEPLSGRLLVLDVGLRGRPEYLTDL
ncbi:Sugar lactone lactonase YvrE [Rhizobium aethiopicum]|uniref:Sugar lactone lactonase YvrE n=1 Tax=Rhizobium aethiopicum TaxID=1138170 RepID=A0A1C3Y2G0_9HYPH|nr:SMP-30/gluconolactonase/LRE family protein [Rhizobium aethiopicum]SCB58651.1 Sugar lactone lactonase YvrE [Rhizobium aethiopicum]